MHQSWRSEDIGGGGESDGYTAEGQFIIDSPDAVKQRKKEMGRCKVYCSRATQKGCGKMCGCRRRGFLCLDLCSCGGSCGSDSNHGLPVADHAVFAAQPEPEPEAVQAGQPAPNSQLNRDSLADGVDDSGTNASTAGLPLAELPADSDLEVEDSASMHSMLSKTSLDERPHLDSERMEAMRRDLLDEMHLGTHSSDSASDSESSLQ